MNTQTRTANLTTPPRHRMIASARTRRAAFNRKHREALPGWWLKQAMKPNPDDRIADFQSAVSPISNRPTADPFQAFH